MEKLKIRENDVLWGFYLKASSEKPKTLCQYFTVALFGAFLHFYILNRFARIAVAALILTCVVNAFHSGDSGFLTTVASILMVPAAVVALIGECHAWKLTISERMSHILEKICTYMFWIMIGGMVSLTVFAGNASKNWTWLELLHDACFFVGCLVNTMIVIAVTIGAFIYVKNKYDFSMVKRLFSQTWGYLMAIKNRACPLVDAPDIK